MAEAIPGAELHVIEDGSHTAPIERPHLFDQMITDFLTRRVDKIERMNSSS
jgi:pimeloyl-ACP methyl ester carboxylesterase